MEHSRPPMRESVAIVLPGGIALGSWLTATGTPVRFTSRSAVD
ncbi:hypothetical protein [Cryobacterium flavum]|nr:hypothetical protein [Cryobacterium flavum]